LARRCIVCGETEVMSKELTEYQCFICGRKFKSAQGLRGHLKVHKGMYKEVSFLAVKETYEQFKELCKQHGLTTCHMLNSFMHLAVEAFRRGCTLEVDVRKDQIRLKSGSNPVIFNLVQFFGGAPRGKRKYDFSAFLPDGQTCSLCNRRAVWACADTYGKELLLCDKHAWLRHQFEVFRRL